MDNIEELKAQINEMEERAEYWGNQYNELKCEYEELFNFYNEHKREYDELLEECEGVYQDKKELCDDNMRLQRESEEKQYKIDFLNQFLYDMCEEIKEKRDELEN